MNEPTIARGTMKKDWTTFSRFFLRVLRGSMIALPLVPLFYFMLNPHLNRETLPGLLISLRIGLEVLVVNAVVSSLIYGLIYKWNIPQLIRLKGSVKLRFAMGFTGMLLGLLVASYLESSLGGQGLNLQGMTTGLLIGGITYLVFVLKSAYTEAQNHNLKLRAEFAESNLNALKNQMQPHFLFNSLNSLAELIDSNREYASLMTQKLSDLYREILEASKTQASSLESEISIVKKYLDLETLRFGSRLRYEIQVPPSLEGIFIPSLLLQTLVENAIKHGISQNLQGGVVILNISPADSGYTVRIQNTSPQKSQGSPSLGTGIANTISRLDLLYGERHNFKLNSINGETQVEFWFSGVLNA